MEQQNKEGFKLLVEKYTKNVAAYEFEIRFGTKKGYTQLTKDDASRVISVIKTMHGFEKQSEDYMLRTYIKGKDARVEINGFSQIQDLCKHNSISKSKYTQIIKKTKEDEFDVDEYEFRISLQKEIAVSDKEADDIIENWTKYDKSFRYIKRMSYVTDKFPVKIDISIVKDTTMSKKTYSEFKMVNLGSIEEKYEIEIEVMNDAVLEKDMDKSPLELLNKLRECVKFVLCGIQSSNYPMSKFEMRQILDEYSQLVWKRKKEKHDMFFIGPSSVTLQMENLEVAGIYKDVSIRSNYSVTDKADGLRKMLYVSKMGNVYLIDQQLNVQLTGAAVDKKFAHTLVDGEHVGKDKNGKYMNSFLAFDIYHVENQNVRELPFYMKVGEFSENTRHSRLQKFITEATSTIRSIITKAKGKVPIDIKSKMFYFDLETPSQIFKLCDTCLNMSKDSQYNTDGLIFTPCEPGVGGYLLGKSASLDRKTTWMLSFKWKPPHFNTIDFLVNTEKDSKTNKDRVTNRLGELGTSMISSSQIKSYKTLILKVGYDADDKRNQIIPNACAMIYEGNIDVERSGGDMDTSSRSRRYMPIQFIPTSPYKSDAGICEIELNSDGEMITEEGDVFEDLTIVEFRYDAAESERWIPLRVRYDKTSELRHGMKQYGNAYRTANSIWHSICVPVTEYIIRSGDTGASADAVSDDVYYNTSGGLQKTDIAIGLREFHNKYVKANLIYEIARRGNRLIDFAVGKGGDIHKWYDAGLSFVFGIDISQDNIENPADGACSRYVNHVRNKVDTYKALFVVGDSSQNIMKGDAYKGDSQMTKNVSDAVFGIGNIDSMKRANMRGVVDVYGIGKDGFDISSIQFAIHYMFKNKEALEGFLINVASCTRVGGYFIGTAFNGARLFDLLKASSSSSWSLFNNANNKLIEIRKKYDYSEKEFPSDETSLGFEVEVWQESINQYISEYLVSFEYLDLLMSKYGFEVPSTDVMRADGITFFKKARASFKVLYDEMSKTGHPEKYGNALKMSNQEKMVSFLNDYFIYKKVRSVNATEVSKEPSKPIRKLTFVVHDNQGLIHTALHDRLVDDGWKSVKLDSKTADFAWIGADASSKGLGFQYDDAVFKIHTTLKNVLRGGDGNSSIYKVNVDKEFPYSKNILLDSAYLYSELFRKYSNEAADMMNETWNADSDSTTIPFKLGDVFVVRKHNPAKGVQKFIIDSKSELDELMQLKKQTSAAATSEYIIYKYCKGATTIGDAKTKYNVRMYFCVCMKPNKVIDWNLFEKGQIITAGESYREADYKNPKIHDPQFSYTTKFRIFPDSAEIEASEDEKVRILKQMKKIAQRLFLIYKPYVNTTSNSKYGFEVFACDFGIFDSNKNVKLLQIKSKHDYGIKFNKEDLYDNYCSLFFEWIYKNAIEPVFLTTTAPAADSKEAAVALTDVVQSIKDEGFPYVKKFWNADNAHEAYEKIKDDIGSKDVSKLEDDKLIQYTPYDFKKAWREDEKVNEFIKKHVGTYEDLKFMSKHFVSIHIPKQFLNDDYLLVDYFTEESRVTVKKAENQPSLLTHFNEGTLIEEIIKYSKKTQLSEKEMHTIISSNAIKMSNVRGKDYRVYIASAENVIVYIAIIRLLYPNLQKFTSFKILDGAGGYGSRLMAALVLGAEYVGVEPNPNSSAGFASMIEMFGNAPAQVMLEDGLPKASGVIQLPLLWADVVFFSPPMWGKEVYNEEGVPNQSTQMFRDEELWLKGFLYASIDVLWERVKNNGFIVFQSLRYDYIGNHMRKKSNAVFKGIISRVTSSGRFKPNWIWQKTEEEEPAASAVGSTAPPPAVKKKKIVITNPPPPPSV